MARQGWLIVAITLCPSVALAGLIPGPGEPGYDPALEAKADAFDVQLHQLITTPLGFGLEAYVGRPEHRAAIDAFFAAGATDLRAHSGLHPYQLVDEYEEYGDLGMFGGVQAAGDAFHYAVLRDGGAAAERVDRARADLLRAMDGVEWQHRITGVPGVIARGLRRVLPEAGEPPLPGVMPEQVPLFDGDGPLPKDKTPTWRADRSGELPHLIWIDDASKDQLDGYVFALGVIWDVTKDDPTIDAGRKQRLAEVARAIGLRLLELVDIGTETPLDLVIRDADGRPATYHDLNARLVLPGVAGLEPSSGFNGLLALGIIETLATVSDDPRLRAFYAEELVGRRNYLGLLETSLADLVYFDELTNYSNVNMMFVAIYGLLRYDHDPLRARRIRRILESQAYAPGRPHEARGLKQSFFDLIYAGFRNDGVDGPGATAVTDALETLEEHPSPPYWNVDVDNCDAQEIEASSCTAPDGTALAIDSKRGLGGAVLTAEPVPMRLRPSNNFLWRSDPHQPNGSASTRLNPGGDFHAAYWMGRFLQKSSDGLDNLAPEPGPDAERSCGCRTSRRSGSPVLGLAALLLCSVIRRRQIASGPA